VSEANEAGNCLPLPSLRSGDGSRGDRPTRVLGSRLGSHRPLSPPQWTGTRKPEAQVTPRLPVSAPPGEHTVGVGLVEQAMRAEVEEDTSLDNVLEFVPVLGHE